MGLSKTTKKWLRIVLYVVCTVLLYIGLAMYHGKTSSSRMEARLATAVSGCGKLKIYRTEYKIEFGQKPGEERFVYPDRTGRYCLAEPRFVLIEDPKEIRAIVDNIRLEPNAGFGSWICACNGDAVLQFEMGSRSVQVRVHHGESLRCGLWNSDYWMTDSTKAYIAGLLSRLDEKAEPADKPQAGKKAGLGDVVK